MANLTTPTLAKVQPLLGAITRPVVCGEIIDVGEAVYIKSDGKAWLADAAAAATSKARGICVGIAGYGKTSSVVGDTLDVVFYGPVEGWAGLTPGVDVFASVTAGALADAEPIATNYIWVVGYAKSATTIFVAPFTYDVAVVT